MSRNKDTGKDAEFNDETHNPEDQDSRSVEPDAPKEPDAVGNAASGEGAGVAPGGGEQVDVDEEAAGADEGMLTLDELLADGSKGSSCSIDGTCD